MPDKQAVRCKGQFDVYIEAHAPRYSGKNIGTVAYFCVLSKKIWLPARGTSAEAVKFRKE